MALLTPRRRYGHEYLDDPAVGARVAARSMGDVARSNALFGGAHAVLAELDDLLRPGPEGTRSFSLLDVGTGLGDIPARVRARAAEQGVTVCTMGLDTSEALAIAAHDTRLPMLRADARQLPIADRAFDVVICSQVLHHFRRDDGIALLRELDRVARRRVIVSDIRRSWLAAAGIWLASWPLRFHPVSRHDGVVSVLRGFIPEELQALVHAAVGVTPRVRRYRGFRVAASWVPPRSSSML
ncbi:MAG TPA: methyltransferase domain-containing protein [Gemmatimonadaceae bacterium]|nr:methyltransferase domain-containing protein [Gemmatimonadaceae bacterium]